MIIRTILSTNARSVVIRQIDDEALIRGETNTRRRTKRSAAGYLIWLKVDGKHWGGEGSQGSDERHEPHSTEDVMFLKSRSSCHNVPLK